MGKFKIVTASVSLALGIVAGVAPAASATTCEAVLGDEACAQVRDTGNFALDTVASLGPIVDEQRDRIAAIGKTVSDTVWCVVGGGC